VGAGDIRLEAGNNGEGANEERLSQSELRGNCAMGKTPLPYRHKYFSAVIFDGKKEFYRGIGAILTDPNWRLIH
jgi:hypothetical protein